MYCQIKVDKTLKNTLSRLSRYYYVMHVIAACMRVQARFLFFPKSLFRQALQMNAKNKFEFDEVTICVSVSIRL